jgi:hypothetical protein
MTEEQKGPVSMEEKQQPIYDETMNPFVQGYFLIFK